MLQIDGALGEGGGQILRTSLSLSLVTGRPFRLVNIRAGRERPGLLRQHLTAVLAAAEVSGAEVTGAELGSTAIAFSPGKVQPGAYRFAVGTAGSSTLVLQTVLPALVLAEGPSHVSLEGGTHNPAAPPYHFLSRAFLPLIARMGPQVTPTFGRYGFYPAGGGSFDAQIQPAKALRPLHLGPRGALTSRRITAVAANLPRHIAQREAETAAAHLQWGPECQEVECTRESAGPGNIIMVELGSDEVTEVFTAFGQLGVTAERVGKQVGRAAAQYLWSGAAAGEHLTDQLLLPMALAGEGSFTAAQVNLHARTNMEVIAKFLPVRFHTMEEERLARVTVMSDIMA